MLQFREAGYDAVDMICDYLEVLPYVPVVPAIQVSTELLPCTRHGNMLPLGKACAACFR